jgi:hypothetical protein
VQHCLVGSEMCIRDSISLGNLTNSQLITAQKQFQKNRDLSALFIVGFYVLNIIEANVDASLLQFNVDNRLSIKPNIERQNTLSDSSMGLTLVYRF